MEPTRGRQPDRAVCKDTIELYKLAVEMADRVSARRSIANSFFLTVNTSIVALLSVHGADWYLAVAGIVFAVTWWALLKSYRDLNEAKFEVIVAMEQQLPVRVFGEEWELLRRDPAPFRLRRTAILAWLSRYRELGRVERVVPWAFAAICLAQVVQHWLA